MSERSVEHGTIVIERSYPASPERTFAAWADAEAKARRFGVSEGELELDFRVGGRERHRGTLPDGRVYTYQATYQDIIRPRRILYTYEMLLDGSRVSISLATAELTPEGDGTRLVFTEQGAFLDGHETPARRDQGRAACWTRWARSCRANKQPPERPTDSHAGATRPPSTAFTPQRATLLLGWAGRTAPRSSAHMVAENCGDRSTPVPTRPSRHQPRSHRWSRPRPSHELECVAHVRPQRRAVRFMKELPPDAARSSRACNESCSSLRRPGRSFR
jgi:uncharacterized protein YndB with AHSA1/START domain